MSARNTQAKPASALGNFLTFAPLILAVSVIMGVVQWMGQQPLGLDSAQALQQAEQLLDRDCATQSGGNTCKARLLEATPMPSQTLANANHWEFRFSTQKAKTVTVQVDEQGVTRLKPGAYFGEHRLIKRFKPSP